MGYTISKSSVLRNKEQLEQLLEKKTSLVFRTKTPARLAHKLREAIAAAKHFEEFEHFAVLKYMYQFKVRQHEVLALYEGTPEGIPLGESLDAQGEKALLKETVPEATSLIEILSAVLQSKGKADEIFFPNADITENDQEKLFEWTQENDWKYIDHGEDGLTLTQRDVPEEVLWSPEEE